MLACLVHLGDVGVMAGTSHLLRLVCRRLLRGEARLLAEELVSTGDFCSCCFELAFLYETFGTVIFTVALFIMCLWWCTAWGDAAVNPNKHIEDYVKGEASLSRALGRIAAELVAACGTFWSVFVWYLDPVTMPRSRAPRVCYYHY